MGEKYVKCIYEFVNLLQFLFNRIEFNVGMKLNFFFRFHLNAFQIQAEFSKPKFRTKKKKVVETKVKFSSGDKLVSNENWNKTAQHAHILFIIILCSPTHLDADHSFAVAKWLFYRGPDVLSLATQY